VAPGDALRVAEGLLRLMDDRDAYISISNRNYGYARDHFSCTAVARKLDEIYREVILCKAAS
jgi:glycosyltransferase involved in cell wall biosynthesis